MAEEQDRYDFDNIQRPGDEGFYDDPNVADAGAEAEAEPVGGAQEEPTVTEGGKPNESEGGDGDGKEAAGENGGDQGPDGGEKPDETIPSFISEALGVSNKDELLAKVNSIKELETQLDELKKAPKPKFANEYIERLNELFSSNADKEEIDRFIKVNNAYSSEMTSQEKVSLYVQLTEGVSPEEAQEYMDEMYSVSDDDSATERIKKKKALKGELEKAESFFAENLKGREVSEPNVLSEEEKVTLANQYNGLIDGFKKNFKVIDNIDISLPDDDILKDQSISFDVPADFEAEMKDTINNYINIVYGGERLPKTKEELDSLKSAVRDAALVKYYPEIMRKAVSNASSIVKQSVHDQYAGRNKDSERPAGSKGGMNSVVDQLADYYNNGR